MHSQLQQLSGSVAVTPVETNPEATSAAQEQGKEEVSPGGRDAFTEALQQELTAMRASFSERLAEAGRQLSHARQEVAARGREAVEAEVERRKLKERLCVPLHPPPPSFLTCTVL